MNPEDFGLYVVCVLVAFVLGLVWSYQRGARTEKDSFCEELVLEYERRAYRLEKRFRRMNKWGAKIVHELDNLPGNEADRRASEIVDFRSFRYFHEHPFAKIGEMMSLCNRADSFIKSVRADKRLIVCARSRSSAIKEYGVYLKLFERYVLDESYLTSLETEVQALRKVIQRLEGWLYSPLSENRFPQ